MMLLRSTAVAMIALCLPHFGCATSGPADAASLARSEHFDIEVKLITGHEAACERVLGPSALDARVVTAAEAASLIDAASQACNIVSRPRISVSGGSTAWIGSIAKTDYVQDFDVDARPITSSIEHGVRILATPKTAADDKSEVTLSIEVSGMHSPIPQREVTLPGSAKTVTVQMPEFEVQQVQTSVVLGDDEAALVRVGPTPGDDPVRAVVLRVHRRP
jgi:hypothetical protein